MSENQSGSSPESHGSTAGSPEGNISVSSKGSASDSQPAGPSGSIGAGGSDNDSNTDTRKLLDLDDLLVNELGQFGRYQQRNFFLVVFPLIADAFPEEFIFGAAAIPHRCRIHECGENSKSVPFKPGWLSNAIPKDSAGSFASCRRYAGTGGAGTLDSCSEAVFDKTKTVACAGYVYERYNTVVYDFDLGCQEWLRVQAGLFHSVGTLFAMPIVGAVSDHFGRRVALVMSLFFAALFGFIRAFSFNYAMYVTLQLLQTTLGSGAFCAAYIFATEFVGPKHRLHVSTSATALFSVGEVVLGLLAWMINSWRTLLLVLNAPMFLLISYYWIMSESVRWLMSKKKYAEAKIVLERVAKANKKQISTSFMNALMNLSQGPITDGEKGPGLVMTICRSRILLRRVCTTPVWWITCTFIYYGLTVHSTNLSEKMHLNYILTALIEIPGIYVCMLVMDRIGRRTFLSICFFLTAACNITFTFIPNDLQAFRMSVFLLGKLSISATFAALYLFTSELYPTEYRHTLIAFSSMVGRIGTITVMLTSPLQQYWRGIPTMMFGCMGIISGVLVLTQPETLGTRMPDTLAEAEAIGQKSRPPPSS